jgi:hypothetical protein
MFAWCAPRHSLRKQKKNKHEIHHRPDVQYARDVQEYMKHMRRMRVDTMQTDKGGGYEQCEHDAKDRVDDAVLTRRIDDLLDCHEDYEHHDHDEEHVNGEVCIYIQRLCVISMMSTLWNAGPPMMHLAKMRILSPYTSVPSWFRTYGFGIATQVLSAFVS